MANQNIFQQRVTPEKPRILRDERVFVYVPTASNDAPGIASFNSRDFGVNDGKVSLLWPMQMDVERLADPLTNVSRIKVTEDEFVNTGKAATLVNPVTGETYTSATAEVKLNRKNRDAFTRPDLVMLDGINDFEVTQDAQEQNKYTLKKNNPLEQPSLVQLNNEDFVRPNGIVDIAWPLAHDPSIGTDRTDGYGLVKIAPNGEGNLRYANGLLEVDFDAVSSKTKPKPTYGADASTGFDNIGDYVGPDGLAKTDSVGHPLLAITKEAVGLSKVANKAFGDYTYSEFGQSMQSTFTDKFGAKLDKTTWDNMFADWQPPTSAKDTPQKWFQALEAEDDSLWDTLRSIRMFLGYFDDLSHLTSLYPANNNTFGSMAYLLDHRSYFAVRTANVDKMFATDAEATAFTPPKNYTVYVTGSKATGNRFQWLASSKKYTQIGTNDAIYLDYFLANDEDLAPFIEEHKATLVIGDRIGIRETNQIFIWNGTIADLSSETVYYEWYDTAVANLSFADFMETQANIYKANGVAAAGSSGKWAQSDHVHPTDLTRLAESVYKTTNVTICSELTPTEGEQNFVFNLWEQDENGVYVPNRKVNVPYVRKAKGLHNWQGQTEFVDTEVSTESYWGGTAAEFAAQQANIPNNSFIVVEDSEDFTTESFLSASALDVQGITIDDLNPTERFVIVKTSAVPGPGRVLTLRATTAPTGTNRYELTAVELGNVSDKIVVTANGGITSKTLTPGKIIVTASETGGITTDVDYTSLLRTSGGTLARGSLLMSSVNNQVSTFNGGTNVDVPIVSNGSGSIRLKTFTTPGALVAVGSNNALDETDFVADNALVTSASSTVTILPAGQIVISGSGNQVTTYDTGSLSGRGLVSNGAGGVRLDNTPANKLIYSEAIGTYGAFPMTAADAGKVVGVDASGSPTLLVQTPHPSTLPVTTYSTNPGANVNGLVIAKLDSDPGTYSQGVLYLW